MKFKLKHKVWKKMQSKKQITELIMIVFCLADKMKKVKVEQWHVKSLAQSRDAASSEVSKKCEKPNKIYGVCTLP